MHDDVSPTIEGRLMAHRHILARLIARLAAMEAGQDWLNTTFAHHPTPQDGQEDPGAVPDLAFAILAIRDQELALIGDEVHNILASAPRTD